jgi:hypothetical protein
LGVGGPHERNLEQQPVIGSVPHLGEGFRKEIHRCQKGAGCEPLGLQLQLRKILFCDV